MAGAPVMTAAAAGAFRKSRLVTGKVMDHLQSKRYQESASWGRAPEAPTQVLAALSTPLRLFRPQAGLNESGGTRKEELPYLRAE